ncbi:hypothetical protein XH81_30100 [Bradyrhizobium sp. CCBAU 25360]|uniref:DNA -binding domain-containing protein n=1 Tax=Bradyrhizobium sp. CCBAU 25360 TaxID=858425 RepID=UPI0023069A76|nr:DUF2285 domain-containing protein [Bradyrhizobium sp. CCBAU 25360]MDA9419093.1 hypothetical protein [Bradyrhizobium sp. CCBAU 25360]
MPAEPKIAELAPSLDELTSYDKEHAVAYMRLLDADADEADWREIARIVLGLDPTVEPDRARRTFESHLTRAKWLAGKGYRDLLRSGWPRK